MARPRKTRRICMDFGRRIFVAEPDAPCVVLEADELEALRLADLEELDQAAAAERMRISRGTLQRLLREARRKLVFALLEGRSIATSRASEHCKPCCDGDGGCRFCGRRTRIRKSSLGEGIMRIAVVTETGNVFQHFGHAPEVTLYDVEDDAVKNKQVESTDGCGHGALAGFLRERNVELLICGGIGAGAQMALAEAGIRLAAGVEGNADQAVEAFLAGTLASVSNPTCGGHGHGHGHGEGRSCGGHGHGEGHEHGEGRACQHRHRCGN